MEIFATPFYLKKRMLDETIQIPSGGSRNFERGGGGGGGGGELANKLFFFPENISKYRNKVQTIILIKV